MSREKQEKELRHVYFPVETVIKLEKIAKKEYRDVNNLIAKIVVDYADKEEIK